MNDIETRDDIEHLVYSFYQQLLNDSTIAFIFKNYMDIPLEKHLPIMYDFWESILLDKLSYKGNPILTHLQLHKKVSLTEAHFKQWILLWNATIDSSFVGPKANDAKARAAMMKELMLYKIEQSSSSNFIQ